MGINGWTKLLVEHGLLAQQEEFRSSLWRTSPKTQSIPAGSQLHVDGNGLAFFLYKVAVARHIESIVDVRKREKGPNINITVKGIPSEEIPSSLRSFIPLSLIQAVTTEFVTALHPRYSLTVYWDGSDRKLTHKQWCNAKRQAQRAKEWATLHQYCLTGVLPAQGEIWSLPLPLGIRLAVAQVQHVLHHQCRLKRVDCPGEADDFIARHATGQSAAYIVGSDSDFTLFPEVQYLPLTCLDCQDKQLYGIVLQRSQLTTVLDVPDAEALIELALAYGNDFVPRGLAGTTLPDTIEKGFRWSPRSLTAEFDGAVINLSSEHVELAMDFCRRWYNLLEIHEHEMLSASDHADEGGDSVVLEHQPSSVEPKLPLPLEPGSMMMTASDRSVLDPVTRCLDHYVKHNLVNADVVKILCSMTKSSKRLRLTHRPTWEHVSVCCWVEILLSKSYKINAGHPMVRISPPSLCFDSQTFLQLLHESTSTSVTDVSASPDNETPVAPSKKLELPIDEHRDTILEAVATNRVIIIQGETGCGKSTRIPVMLLEDEPDAKIMVSQPRRIAAKALVERLRNSEPELCDAFALRMGHGVREYENSETRAWFVTAGYLVRLLANHPEQFDKFTHIIIDEVHERSVDTDILCLLCKRLLQKNERIRLVLMSATLAAGLYQSYFEVQHPVIFVGARRFPVREVYLEDLGKNFPLLSKMQLTVSGLVEECTKLKCKRPPSPSYLEKLYSVVAYLATVIGKPGSAVLVFVPGMNDIVAISEMIEQLFVPGLSFKCLPVHGDIPFEDQMSVFSEAGPKEVKIIIATNAAESSVTLPDCDHVVCLGMCKQIVYNEASHRQMLTPTWISRASATQRAGRTSRVRAGGTVYRLYTRDVFERWMEPFEPGEMVRIPLDSVILMLKQIVSEEAVTDVLSSCLEPPDIKTIEKSFQSLFDSHFITSPDDACKVTTLGRFVSALGIDLALGSLIGLGIQFGVGAEAIQIAGILSFPKSPWVISNPLIHTPKDYNHQVAKTYSSRCYFDGNLYSEPLAIMNVLWEFQVTTDKQKWCWRHGLFLPRIRHLFNTCNSLKDRVASFMNLPPNSIAVSEPPVRMPYSKITVLRIIQAWVFHGSTIELDLKKSTKGLSKCAFTIELKAESAMIDQKDLHQVLPPDRHEFQVVGQSKTSLKGKFTVPDSCFFSIKECRERVLSYAIEKSISVIFMHCDSDEDQIVYIDEVHMSKQEIMALSNNFQDDFFGTEEIIMSKVDRKNSRGRAERSCGIWTDASQEPKKDHPNVAKWLSLKVPKCSLLSRKECTSLNEKIQKMLASNHLKGMYGMFEKNVASEWKFVFTFVGIANVAEIDVKDLCAAGSLHISSTKQTNQRQQISFPLSQDESSEMIGFSPIAGNIPEGARILSVLATGRRRPHTIRLQPQDKADDKGENDESMLDIFPNPSQTNISERWKRVNTKSQVYMEANSVPATAIPLHSTENLYCLCANVLEIRGGGLKVDGLTLLPQGLRFRLLCGISFGLLEDSMEAQCLACLQDCHDGDAFDLARRIEQAFSFHQASQELGEALRCFPDKVTELLAIFDELNGKKCIVWPELERNPFIQSALNKTSMNSPGRKFDGIRQSCDSDSELLGLDDARNLSLRSKLKKTKFQNKQEAQPRLGVNSPSVKEHPYGEMKAVSILPTDMDVVLDMCDRAFDDVSVENLFQPPYVHGNGPPITLLVLSFITYEFWRTKGIVKHVLSPFGAEWSYFEISSGSGRLFYACFDDNGIGYTRQISKMKRKRPWIVKVPVQPRPDNIEDALDCVPSPFRSFLNNEAFVVSVNGKHVVAFKTMRVAVVMEAAFWLERQFCTSRRHWYDLDIFSMLRRLQ